MPNKFIKMHSKEHKSKSNHKLSGIAVFFIGFSLGILIFVFAAFVFKNVLFFKNLNPTELFDQDSKKQTAEDFVKPRKKSVKKSSDFEQSTADSLAIDSTAVVIDEETDYLEDSEFYMDESVSEGKIAEEKMLQSKTVKVIVKNSKLEDQHDVPDNIIAYFEVQKWESPIVNRLVYQRKHNVLKIKGMDISRLSIFYINGKYYITDGGRLFPIPNNSDFEKLSEINIANL